MVVTLRLYEESVFFHVYPRLNYFPLATGPIQSNCVSIVKELVRHRPLHIAIRHCCNYTKIRYDCINGYRLEEGDKIHVCKDGKILGKQPKCRFPKGKLQYGFEQNIQVTDSFTSNGPTDFWLSKRQIKTHQSLPSFYSLHSQ